MTPPKTSAPVLISWEAGAPPPDLDEADLSAALARFLDLLGHRAAGISVLFADDARLHALNRAHRSLDRTTDVLSWSYLEAWAAREGAPEGTPPETDEAPALLGELALSLERATAQASENGWPLRTEVLRLLAHGCAHVAGYDHETEAEEREMKAVEVRLLAALSLRELYPPDRPA